MVAVTGILLLLFTLIVPNLVALERSRALRNKEAELMRLPNQAKDLAQQLNTPMVMHMDGNDLVVEVDTDVTQSPISTTMPNQSRTPNGPTSNNQDNKNMDVQKRVTLGDDIRITSAQLNGENVDAGSWKWEVFPDGSAQSAGLEFTIGNDHKALYMPTNEPMRWINGDLPDPTQENWAVGQIEARTTGT
jgi:hypothetical protein